MSELHEGDLLAIMSVGAYGFVMASNYNSRPYRQNVGSCDKFALIGSGKHGKIWRAGKLIRCSRHR